MKKVLFLLLLLCAGYWGALNQAKLKTWWQSLTGHSVPADVAESGSDGASTAASESDAAPSSAPAPSPTKAAPPAPTPSVPDVSQAPVTVAPLASGFYYTRERLSQTTDAGIAAIPAGTEVRAVSEQNGQIVVEANGKRVTTSMAKLTNDPIEIQALLQEAKAAQAAADAAKAAKDAARKAANAPPAPPTLEENKRRRQILQAKILDLDRQVGTLSTQMAMLQAEAMQAKDRGRPSTYNDRTIANIRAQISAIEAARSQLVAQEAAIP